MGKINRTENILPQACDEYDRQHNLAALYSSSSTYDVDKYVIYEGDLYRCHSAISAPEEWNPDRWIKVTVTGELGSGGTKLDEASWVVDDGKAYLDLKNEGTSVILSDGLEIPDAHSIIGNSAIGTSNTGVYYDGDKFLAVVPEHQTSKNVVSNSAAATSNGVSANGSTYLNHLEETTITSSHNIIGTGTVSVISDASGNITINGTAGEATELKSNPYGVKVDTNGIHMQKNETDFGLFADSAVTVPKVNVKIPGSAGSHYSIIEDTDGSLVFTVE